MKNILNTLVLILIIILSFNSFAAGGLEEGPATSYKITMTKLELCTGAPLSDAEDITCTGSVVVGEGSKTFDITSVSAGADVGTFANTSGLPIGTTFTHAKPTMTRTFTIKGYAPTDTDGTGNCYCRTEADATFNSSIGKYKSWMRGVCETSQTDAETNEEEQTLYLLTDGSDISICANDACSSKTDNQNYNKDVSGDTDEYGLAMEDPAVSQDTFSMIYKFKTPYTVGITAPKISIAFGTQRGVQGNEYSDGLCVIGPYYPRVQLTVTE